MPETHLSHDEFFNKLGELFTSRKGKDHGSVFLTQKRMTHGLDDKDDDDNTTSSSYPVIVRATNGKSGDDRKAGKKVKLSTVVPSDSLDAFYVRYAEICKAGIGSGESSLLRGREPEVRVEGFKQSPIYISSPSARHSNTSLTFLHSSHSPFSGLLATPTYMTRFPGHLASGSKSSQLASFLCASHRRPQLVHL
ncbi:hypothetical protein VMCG_09641 [Cytospora schulzeri]|uniref:Signal recognition particle subunit SRP14 n=1 Tax=Cytospora schulzeri TaxID=448051 RepID=A0A423VEG2_9PEZI|nr:hypothetical protein VMCG_09641 [Valsa malicola]